MPKISKREEKALKNQNLLRKILELKQELFGQFSPIITKETRKKAWLEIRDYAICIGLIGAEKDFTYVRDATWPNLRNRTVSKIDLANKTGCGGKPDSKLDDCDKIVLEIIGKESPVMKGIGVVDSMTEEIENVEIIEDIINTDSLEIPCAIPSTSKIQHHNSYKSAVQGPSKGSRKKIMAVQNAEDGKYIQNLKLKKLQLEVRKLELEVWEKEIKLNVEHSAHTRDVKPNYNSNNEIETNSSTSPLYVFE